MTDKLRIPERREVSAAWIERHTDYLLNELADAPAAQRRRRRVVIALVPAVAILLAATAFTTYSLTREPKHLESIGCFHQASLPPSMATVSAPGRDPVPPRTEGWHQ